jgi:hypothetical protein
MTQIISNESCGRRHRARRARRVGRRSEEEVPQPEGGLDIPDLSMLLYVIVDYRGVEKAQETLKVTPALKEELKMLGKTKPLLEFAY